MDNKTLIEEIFKKIMEIFVFENVSFSIDEEEENIKIKVGESEEAGFLIGYHGQTLESIEFILSLILFYNLEKWQRVCLEVGDYQERKEEILKNMVLKAMEKVKFLKEPVSLLPMSAKERRFVHMYLKEHESFGTSSEGEGSERHIVISMKAA